MPSLFTAQDFRKIAGGTAATVLVCMLSFTVPVLGILFFLLIPLPLIFYRVRLDRKQGLIIAAAACVLLAAAGNPGIDLFFLGAMIMLGICMGEFIGQQRRVEQVIGTSCGAVLLTGILGLIVYSNLVNTGVIKLISGYIRTNLEMTIRFYQEIGISQETVDTLKAAREQIQFVLLRIIPGLVAASLMFAAWLNLLLARNFIRAGHPLAKGSSTLNTWGTPDHLVWAVIVCGILLLIPNTALKLIAINGLIILMVIYFFQGVAVISYYFEKKHIPIIFRFLFYLFIALQQILMLVVMGVGFFDVWGDFRRLGSGHRDENDTKTT